MDKGVKKEMKVKVPNQIKIGLYPYSVKAVPHLKLNEGTWGVTNHAKREIKIDSNLSIIELNQTLIHEVIHIISEGFRCGLDEDNVERLSNGIGEFLFDNLHIEFLWDDVKEG